MRRSERDWLEGDERTRVFVEETVRAATRASARNGKFPPIGRQLAAWVWGQPLAMRRRQKVADVASAMSPAAPAPVMPPTQSPARAARRDHNARGARLRLTAASVAVAVVGLGSLGGAGALPQPLQNFVAVTVARVGLDIPPSDGPADVEVPGARRPAAPTTVTQAGVPSAPARSSRSRATTRRRSAATTTPTTLPGSAVLVGSTPSATQPRTVPSTSTSTSTTVPTTTPTTVGVSVDPDPGSTTTTTAPPATTTTTAPASPPAPRDPPS